jgi:hypothetical protein
MALTDRKTAQAFPRIFVTIRLTLLALASAFSGAALTQDMGELQKGEPVHTEEHHAVIVERGSLKRVVCLKQPTSTQCASPCSTWPFAGVLFFSLKAHALTQRF